jgi:hypothetical protein
MTDIALLVVGAGACAVSQVSETVHVLRFQCDPTLEERLKQVARDEDRSMSAVIREACRAYVRGER